MDMLTAENLPTGYMEEAELADKLSAEVGRTTKFWRTVIAAIRSGLPIEVTDREVIDGRVSVHVSMHVVEYAVIAGTSTRLRLKSWGFESYWYLQEIDHVEVPHREYYRGHDGSNVRTELPR